MKQAALVALYGDKNADFADLIVDCQAVARSELGDSFRPYDVRQVHATIIGLEHATGTARRNRNFLHYRDQAVNMDIDGFVASLRGSSLFPFSVQIGGFADRDHPFRSDPFGRKLESRPFDRSFSIWHDKAIVMGWPVCTTTDGERYPPILDTIRRSAQTFGILHGYHRTGDAIDNDFYFRIGLVELDAAPPALVRQLRRMLSQRLPVMLKVSLDDLSIVRYSDERLPLDSTESIPLFDYPQAS